MKYSLISEKPGNSSGETALVASVPQIASGAHRKTLEMVLR